MSEDYTEYNEALHQANLLLRQQIGDARTSGLSRLRWAGLCGAIAKAICDARREGKPPAPAAAGEEQQR